MIFHIVLFNPKPNLSAESVQAFTRTLGDCLRSVPQIRRANVGRQLSVDPGYPRSFGEKTYQFAAVLEFDSAEELISYLNHPKHEELGRLFWLNCEGTIVSEHEMMDGKSQELHGFLGLGP